MTVRLIIKTIMRHPAVTLAIIGYNHPGHTFHSKQVVVLLLSPEIVPMIVLDAYSGLLTSAVLCFTNFALYPTFSSGYRAHFRCIARDPIFSSTCIRG